MSYQTQLPCERCKAECCYLVPVFRGELERILRVVRSWSAAEVKRLSRQRRPFGMCPFVDAERWRCSVYEHRPTLCRLYGYTPGLECPLCPSAVSQMAKQEAHAWARLAEAQHGEWSGTLGLDVTWQEILATLREAMRA